MQAKKLLNDNGDIPGLVALMASGQPAAAQQAAWALSFLFPDLSERHAIDGVGPSPGDAIVAAGGMPALVALLPSPTAGVFAARLLGHMWRQSSKYIAAAFDAGVLAALPPLLQAAELSINVLMMLMQLFACPELKVFTARLCASGVVDQLVPLLQHSSNDVDLPAAFCLEHFFTLRTPRARQPPQACCRGWCPCCCYPQQQCRPRKYCMAWRSICIQCM